MALDRVRKEGILKPAWNPDTEVRIPSPARVPPIPIRNYRPEMEKETLGVDASPSAKAAEAERGVGNGLLIAPWKRINEHEN